MEEWVVLRIATITIREDWDRQDAERYIIWVLHLPVL